MAPSTSGQAGWASSTSYGFLGGDTDNWHPALFENTKPVLPPFGDPNYILIHDMANRAIDWIRMQHAIAPTNPSSCTSLPVTATPRTIGAIISRRGPFMRPGFE